MRDGMRRSIESVLRYRFFVKQSCMPHGIEGFVYQEGPKRTKPRFHGTRGNVGSHFRQGFRGKGEVGSNLVVGLSTLRIFRLAMISGTG